MHHNFLKTYFSKLIFWILLTGFLNSLPISAFATALENLNFNLLSDGKVKLFLKFDDKSIYPTSFSIKEPAQLIFDFPNLKNKLELEQIKQTIESNLLNGIEVYTNDTRLRMVVSVSKTVPYTIQQSGNQLEITLADIPVGDILNTQISQPTVQPARPSPMTKKTPAALCALAPTVNPSCGLEASVATNIPTPIATRTAIGNARRLEKFDFKRGHLGETIIILKFSDPDVTVNLQEDDQTIRLNFNGVALPKHLEKRYDVTDFGTPVDFATLRQTKTGFELLLNTTGQYDKSLYQVNDEYFIEIQPAGIYLNLTEGARQRFVGQRLSLNFQDIPIRTILNLLAEFSNINLVASDSITGNITLKLSDVPWDQALDIILKSKGLAQRKEGNILLIGPREEITAREQLELSTQASLENLLPIQTELLQFNYANATEFAAKLADQNSTFLSTRGRVTVDARTNTLLIQDIGSRIEIIKKIISEIDIPVRQVQIEAQIVETKLNLSDALGMRLAGGARLNIGQRVLGIAGNPPVTDTESTTVLASPGEIAANVARGLSELTRGFFFDGPQSSAAAGRLGLSLFRLPGGTLLDLELQAIETEVSGKLLSRPKIVTLDKQKATIEQGVEIPFQSSSANTGTNIEFKSAKTTLEVTPSITPDDKVSLTINLSKDSVSTTVSGTGGEPGVDTKTIQTTVLIDNGETIVIGGLFQQEQESTVTGIPYLSKIPFLGKIFRSRANRNDRSELLVFITPRIIEISTRNQ